MQNHEPKPAATPSPDKGRYRPGDVLAGRYKLLEQIGVGTTAVVWSTEPLAPIPHPLAIKLLRPEADTRETRASFQAEAQALAMLNHPNIVGMFNAGSDAFGRPFLVLQRVGGTPITDFCDRARLTVADRLQLFTAVCDAVQHHHQKGIVHRDLKPTDILTTWCDGRPFPKLIDFGLAKGMVDSSLLAGIKPASFPDEILGTPAYMAPEQAENCGLYVDARADVYSLGVILYELITGALPIPADQFHRDDVDQVKRLLKEYQPLKPSAYLKGSSNLAEVAARRSTSPSRLIRTARGDLDAIIVRCLAKRGDHRYPSAKALADDLRSFLDGLPLLSLPPTWMSRLRNLFSRHPLSVIR